MDIINTINRDLVAANERIAELESGSRVMGCGYCGTEISRYDGVEMPPPDSELARMLDEFQAHDKACPNNPLVADLAAANAEVERLNKELESAEKVVKAASKVIKRCKKEGNYPLQEIRDMCNEIESAKLAGMEVK